MSSKLLQPFLFDGFEEILQSEQIYTIPFPSPWRDVIEKESVAFKPPIKPRSLAQQLHSIFPDILMIQNQWKWLVQGLPWIVAKTPIDIRHIHVVALVNLKHSNLKAKENLHFVDGINWESCLLKDLPQPDYFKIYPGLMARKFASEPREICGIEPLQNRFIRFSTVCTGTTYEAVSDPLAKSKGDESFSYVVRFEVKTRGVENKKLLKVTPAVRRYYQTPKHITDLKRNETCSIYISQNQIFSAPNDSLSSFAKFKIKNQGGRLVWKDQMEEAIRFLYRDMPELNVLFRSPKAYMDKQIFIGYSYRAFENGTSIKPGLSMLERNALVRLVGSVFPDCHLVETHLEVKPERRRNAGKSCKFRNPDKHKQLDLHLYTTDELVKEAESEWLKKGFIIKEEDQLYLNSEPKMLINTVQHGHQLIHDLPIGDGDDKAAQKIYKNELKAHLPETNNNHLTAALIEIEPYHIKGNPLADSKSTIRNALAEKGVPSQFILPLKYEKQASRFQNAFLDLMAAFPFTHSDFDQAFFKNKKILSLSVIKKDWKESLPVLSKIQEGSIVFKTMASHEWMPMNRYLTMKYPAKAFIGNSQGSPLKRWLETCLIEELAELGSGQNLYFVVEATLRNHLFGELKNSELNLGKSPFANWDIFGVDRIKVIRFNLTNDVPNYWVSNKGDDGNNHAKGLFKNNIGIYYSVGEKPKSMQGIAKAVTKIEKQNQPLLRQIAVEIIPLNFSTAEEQDEMAGLVHRLRHMAITFNEALHYPVMMHLANRVKEYIGIQDDYQDYDGDFEDELND